MVTHAKTQREKRDKGIIHRCSSVSSKDAKGKRFEPLPINSLIVRRGFRVVLIAVASFALFTNSAKAGSLLPVDTSDSWQPLDTLWQDFSSIFTDGWLMLQKPAHFDALDWGLTGGLFAGTGLLMTVDEDLRENMLNLRGSDGNALADFGNSLGRNQIGLYSGAILWISGSVINIPKVRLMGRHIFQALIYASTINTLLKQGLGRHRPYLNDGAYVFDGPWQENNDVLSFASGHTVVAFTVASTLAADIENPWVTAGLYSLATLTGLSRMYVDDHWASDVFLGAGLASGIGYGVANLHESSDNDGEISSFLITPTLNGIAVSWQW